MLKVGVHHKSYLHMLIISTYVKVRADANLTFDL